MFKPTHFRFQNSIHWPGAGPTTEVHAENCAKVDDEGDHYTFVHAGGHAVKVAKSEVTAYGYYDADDVPNLPTEDDYKDDVTKLNGENEDDKEDADEEDKDDKEDANVSFANENVSLEDDTFEDAKEDDDGLVSDAPAEPQSSPSFPGTIGDITETETFSNEQFSDSPLDKKGKKKKK